MSTINFDTLKFVDTLKEADDPNTEWFSFEEVFDELRAELGAS